MDAPPRTLALCADDFGQSPGTSRVIASLVTAGRLQAVSCLTGFEAWPAAAALTRDWPDGVDVGLHFNLTEGRPLSEELRAHWPVLPRLPVLLAIAQLRQFPRGAIAAELAAQLRAFHQARGRAPDFIDGHQHVHALLGVRHLVLAAAAGLGKRTALRNTGRVLGPGFGFKRWVIARCGGRALLREMRRRRVPHNPALVGVYGFGADDDFRALMRGWLREVPPEGALLFCHPGADDDPDDPIRATRPKEAAYLAGDDFLADLHEAGVTLGPVWRGRDAVTPAAAGTGS